MNHISIKSIWYLFYSVDYTKCLKINKLEESSASFSDGLYLSW